MTLGNCCCTCVIHEDDFTREDGTPLRELWCDNPGDYYIDDNEARCEIPDEPAILNKAHPNSVGSMVAGFRTIDEIPRGGYNGTGQKYRILVNLKPNISGDPPICTSETYYFAEYERLGQSNQQVDLSWLRLGIVSGGVETVLKARQLIAPETGLSRFFSATIDDDTFCATLDGTVLGQVTTASQGLHDEGYYCGFELSEKDMRIDDFIFQKHYNSNPPITQRQLCPNCGLCQCDDSEPFELPSKLYVCVTTDPAGCERLIELVNCCFEIEYDDLEGGWVHPDFECCAGFNFIFSCDEETGAARYSLGNRGACRQSGGDTPTRNPEEYTCSGGSGSFTFGPYCIAGSDLACACRPVFDITDPPCCYYVQVSTEPCCET